MKTTFGHFAWHELLTPDPAASAAFYQRIVPWEQQPMDDMPDYTVLTSGSTEVGGMLRTSNGGVGGRSDSRWLPYVHVYDVDAAVRQVTSMGGSVRVQPRELPSVGCWAVLADPQGAEFGVYEPATNEPIAPHAPRAGEFSWHELMTTDYKAAFEFYRSLFHWDQTSEFDMGAMGMYRLFGQADQPFGGMCGLPQGTTQPEWKSYIKVDDVRAATPKVSAAGGVVHLDAHEVPGGDMIAQCEDPQGATFALHSQKAS
jgi:uncharacterized protein